MAWDVEHDELAMLVGETLPSEIKAFFAFEDFAAPITYCHYPDMTEYAPWGDSSRTERSGPCLNYAILPCEVGDEYVHA